MDCHVFRGGNPTFWTSSIIIGTQAVRLSSIKVCRSVLQTGNPAGNGSSDRIMPAVRILRIRLPLQLTTRGAHFASHCKARIRCPTIAAVFKCCRGVLLRQMHCIATGGIRASLNGCSLANHRYTGNDAGSACCPPVHNLEH